MKTKAGKKAYSAAYYVANREKLNARNAAYAASHVEEKKAYDVAYCAAHKEEKRAYYDAHKEERRAYDAAYYAAHAEERKAYSAAHRAANPEKTKESKAAYRASGKSRETDLMRIFGVSPECFQLMLAVQQNACGICKEPFVKTPHVDHCHKTEEVRGLLCNLCNVALGGFRDSLEVLENAKEYLTQ